MASPVPDTTGDPLPQPTDDNTCVQADFKTVSPAAPRTADLPVSTKDMNPTSPLAPEVEKALAFLLEASTAPCHPTESKVEAAHIRLSPSHFLQLAKVLSSPQKLGPSYEHIRYSYDSNSCILSINEVPSHLHENVRDEIRDLIKEKLKLIRKRDDVTGAYTRQIRTCNSNPITIMKAGNADSDSASEGDRLIDLKQHPDAQFRHLKARCPGVVIEVSVSQKWEDVRVKTYRLLIKSQAQVGAVINVDYPDHLNSREATLSVWRWTWENGMISFREDLICEQICRPDGTPVTTDRALCISLHDFASPELHGKTEDLVLSFPYRDLGTAVARARREADEWTKEDNVDPKPVPVDMTAIPAEVAAAFALDPEMD